MDTDQVSSVGFDRNSQIDCSKLLGLEIFDRAERSAAASTLELAGRIYCKISTAETA